MAMPCGELNLRSFSGRSGQFSQGGGVQRLKNEFYTTKRTGARMTIGTVLVCAPRVFSWAKLFPQVSLVVYSLRRHLISATRA